MSIWRRHRTHTNTTNHDNMKYVVDKLLRYSKWAKVLFCLFHGSFSRNFTYARAGSQRPILVYCECVAELIHRKRWFNKSLSINYNLTASAWTRWRQRVERDLMNTPIDLINEHSLCVTIIESLEGSCVCGMCVCVQLKSCRLAHRPMARQLHTSSGNARCWISITGSRCVSTPHMHAFFMWFIRMKSNRASNTSTTYFIKRCWCWSVMGLFTLDEWIDGSEIIHTLGSVNWRWLLLKISTVHAAHIRRIVWQSSSIISKVIPLLQQPPAANNISRGWDQWYLCCDARWYWVPNSFLRQRIHTIDGRAVAQSKVKLLFGWWGWPDT